jgi:TetR/AcrR family transcriptional repressor of uid operon
VQESQGSGSAATAAGEASTRVVVIEAAKECFAEYGYRGTSNKKIAARANVTPPLIYYYFSSKAELFSTVFEHITSERYARIRRGFSGVPSLTDELWALIEDLIGLWHEDPAFVRLFAMLPAEVRHNPELAVALKSQKRLVAAVWDDLLRDAKSSGELPPELDERALGEMFVVWFTGLMNSLVARGADEVRAGAEMFVHVVGAGLETLTVASRSQRRTARLAKS